MNAVYSTGRAPAEDFTPIKRIDLVPVETHSQNIPNKWVLSNANLGMEGSHYLLKMLTFDKESKTLKETGEPDVFLPFMVGIGPDTKTGVIAEQVLAALIDRMEEQYKKFPSEYNRRAINHLKEAIREITERINDRIARGVHGEEKI